MDFAQAWAPDAPQHAASALARLPALKSLTLEPWEHDELLVRLLVVAEGGGLPCLKTLHLLNPYNMVLSEGAALLLLLWLKGEAKKALQGEGPGVMRQVTGLNMSGMHDSMKKITPHHLAGFKQARTLAGV